MISEAVATHLLELLSLLGEYTVPKSFMEILIPSSPNRFKVTVLSISEATLYPLGTSSGPGSPSSDPS